MRLTEKKEKYIEELKTNGHIYFIDDILPNNCKLTSRSIDKLGRLEDVEEELGIDLITLVKALKDGIYTNKWLHKTKYGIDLERKRFEGHCSGDYGVVETSYYYFKDYGKTWALTKEELL